MHVIKCPIDGCELTTANVEAEIAAALINTYTITHSTVKITASNDVNYTDAILCDVLSRDLADSEI